MCCLLIGFRWIGGYAGLTETGILLHVRRGKPSAPVDTDFLYQLCGCEAQPEVHVGVQAQDGGEMNYVGLCG